MKMKGLLFNLPSFGEAVSRIYLTSGIAVLVLLVCASAAAQSEASAEEIERHLEEQRIALEQAIAERDAIGEQAQEVQDSLDEAKSVEQALEDELKALCKEQAELQDVSAEECLKKLES